MLKIDMPIIEHKFLDELSEIEGPRMFCGTPIAIDSNVLIIGTFNPSDDGVELINTAPWFYGRFNKNKFWKYFPQAFTQQSLHPKDGIDGHPQVWKDYCVNNRVVIIDLIKSINSDEVLPDFGDKNVEAMITDNLANVSYFNIEAAFNGINFERVVYSLQFTAPIPKIIQIRDIINESLLASDCIQNENQIKYCKTPSRGDSGPSWNSAFQG